MHDYEKMNMPGVNMLMRKATCKMREFAFSILIFSFFFFYFSLTLAHARSVTHPGNKHNLSATGPGIPGITRVEVEERVCVFCHTPHHANASNLNQTPLWSRELSGKTYDLYASSTLKSSPQQPTGSARLCLSCHDGTIALGKLTGGKTIGGLSTPIPVGTANLGEWQARPDLRNDHPISFTYPLGEQELVESYALPLEVKLEDGVLQCTACHDPHNDLNRYFLVKDNKQPGSPLCVTCHNKTGWGASSHASLNLIYPSSPPKGQEEVFACEACHVPHSAQQPQSLLRGTSEKLTCLLTCHNGALPQNRYGQRVDDAFGKMYRHTVGEAVGAHRGDEDPLRLTKSTQHVECVDCHNPHRVNSRVASAPVASGRLEGVKVERLATHEFRLSSTEYDVCFKCHAESYNSSRPIPEILPSRPYNNLNQRERFYPVNQSFHPVMDRVNPTRVNATGLKTSYIGINGQTVALDITRKIYCTDCHNPHGSNEPHMLVATYVQDSFPVSYFTGDYALCYRCHDEAKLLSGSSPNTSFPPHRSHVQNPGDDPLHANLVPCSVCHDPHGVPDSPHLINFDTRTGFVSPNDPVPVYDAVNKSCTVSCHTTGSPDPHTHSY